jgi:hypothetical protein
MAVGGLKDPVSETPTIAQLPEFIVVHARYRQDLSVYVNSSGLDQRFGSLMETWPSYALQKAGFSSHMSTSPSETGCPHSLCIFRQLSAITDTRQHAEYLGGCGASSSTNHSKSRMFLFGMVRGATSMHGGVLLSPCHPNPKLHSGQSEC